MNYGRGVRVARAIAGLEQKELAELAKLDASHISLIERGKRNPTVATLERISQALKVPYHLLTLLSVEAKDLKNVRSSQAKELGEHIAKLLLTESNASKSARKPSRSRSRPKT